MMLTMMMLVMLVAPVRTFVHNKPMLRGVSVKSTEAPSLYEEAERGLTMRGEFEGNLRGTEESLLECGDSVASAVREFGVARVNGALSEATALKLRAFVAEERCRAEADVSQGKIPRLWRFADVLLKKHRSDVLLPLDSEIVADALRELLESKVGSAIEDILGSSARLRELSCLVADPGAPRQVVHPDTPWRTDPALLTCFVSLQQVDDTMGPTLFFPETHTQEAHARFFHADPAVKDDLLKTAPALVSRLGTGDASLFDSRTLHCGTANVDQERSRYLFYFSFRKASVEDTGNPGSIRPCYDSMLTLADMRAALSSSGKKVPTSFADLSEDDFRPFTPPPPRPRAAGLASKKKNNKKRSTTKARGFGS